MPAGNRRAKTVTNLRVDEKLLNAAWRIGGLRTRNQTVTAALEEYIRRRRQRGLLKAIGTIEFRKEWDYKKDRG